MSEISPAHVQPVIVRLRHGTRAFDGWRATLQTDDFRTLWRCDCSKPHTSWDAAMRCGGAALRKRQAHSQQRIKDRGPIANAILSKGESA